MLMRHAIDEVVVALPVKSQYRQIQDTLRICESVGVRAKYRADLFAAEVAWPSYEPADSHFVTMQVAPDDARLIVKRAMDIAGSAVLILLCSPVMIAAAIAVKLTSAGPIIFAQDRFGLNRRSFRMFKFRTMVANAAQLQQQLEDRNEVDGPVFKISDDPRVTKVGRLLRRTSIDELPQLFNVLKGDMSLVGPRPLPLRDIERFTRAGDMRRCSVRPGITCLWQVSGRNNLTFDQWMHLDLQYIDSWSLLLDAVILARTVPAVLQRTGAH
jgi:exopolysaccharide biosynthesis polyprenyl glycosylphosphotransferase